MTKSLRTERDYMKRVAFMAALAKRHVKDQGKCVGYVK